MLLWINNHKQHYQALSARVSAQLQQSYWTLAWLKALTDFLMLSRPLNKVKITPIIMTFSSSWEVITKQKDLVYPKYYPGYAEFLSRPEIHVLIASSLEYMRKSQVVSVGFST